MSQQMMTVVASGRVGTVLRHDPSADDLCYKLSFADGALPEVDWFAKDAVVAGVRGSSPTAEHDVVAGETISYPSFSGSADDEGRSSGLLLHHLPEEYDPVLDTVPDERVAFLQPIEPSSSADGKEPGELSRHDDRVSAEAVNTEGDLPDSASIRDDACPAFVKTESETFIDDSATHLPAPSLDGGIDRDCMEMYRDEPQSAGQEEEVSAQVSPMSPAIDTLEDRPPAAQAPAEAAAEAATEAATDAATEVASDATRCVCGNVLMPDAVYCRKCGLRREDLRVATSRDVSPAPVEEASPKHSSSHRDFWERLNEDLSEIPIIASLAIGLHIPPLGVASVGSVGLLGFLVFGLGAQLVCTMLGVLYPAFESFKAVEAFANLADQSELYAKASCLQFWLTYWVVLAVLASVDYVFYFVLSWIPCYLLAKILLLIWLYLPATRGANHVYHWLVSPILRRNRKRIDNALEHTGKQVNASTRKLRRSVSGAVGKATSNAIDYVMKVKAEELVRAVSAPSSLRESDGNPRHRTRSAELEEQTW